MVGLSRAGLYMGIFRLCTRHSDRMKYCKPSAKRRFECERESIALTNPSVSGSEGRLGDLGSGKYL